ncbi:uncharacterized protein N7529_012138 [Penicillium soppii]|jgi:hypothetical protein|uniref:uncharacterized protein n=1 Tax=Penicillium soppii TaxID=69789 RepID=UPI002548C099|nr:uncharacterized protein N7529_012138 [Penicillium soppii]KAJ5852753.1 hypothetical protein N7529_012138 [Penicillium soppii]
MIPADLPTPSIGQAKLLTPVLECHAAAQAWSNNERPMEMTGSTLHYSRVVNLLGFELPWAFWDHA